jgi:hypothetical protein
MHSVMTNQAICNLLPQQGLVNGASLQQLVIQRHRA